MPERIDAAVVGAGVVGLAAARSLALRGKTVFVLEAERQFGTGTSARSSEVIHAGLYHPATWLKTKFCVEGRARLYAYCEAHGVGHRRCGKVLVATDAAQLGQLHAIAARAAENGVVDITYLTGAEAQKLEPELRCVEALLSPATGIVDSHGLMLSLLGEAEAHGATLACQAKVTRLARQDGAWSIWIEGEPDPVLSASLVVNAAGTGAQKLAAAIEGFPAAQIPTLHLAKGNYFTLSGRAPFSRLIYPMPEPGGAGTHLTLDLAGQARFGPDVEWIAAPDYSVDPARAVGFEADVKRFWPGLPENSLLPAYAGLRPKLSGPGEPAADFRISGPNDHGLHGLINLFGIESPGLTSCLALGEALADDLSD